MARWILVGIIALGFLLRVVGLSNHPAGFTPDEASFGYDAYSILKTGHDQWGNFMPLVFKSFGDDKLPVYTYITVPSIAVFGLNEFAVRLPNAVLGTLAILVIYLLVKEMFKNEKLALLAGFLLSISPWHIMLSRGAFEANLTSFFLPLAILLFMRSFDNKKYLGWAFVFFLINIFTYHTARILTPAVLLFLVFSYREKLKANKTFNITFIFSIVLLVIFVTGTLLGGTRLSSSGIFNLGFADDRYQAQVVGEPNVISKIFYNNPLYVVRLFVSNYLSYISPQFLFTNGPNEGTYGMVPGVGVIYFVEIIFLGGFIWKSFKDKSKEVNLFLFWILISPIPAALTKGPGYAANRAAIVIVPLVVILAIGGFHIYEKLKTVKLKKLFVVGYSVLLLVNFVYVFERYWVGQTVSQAASMVYGVGQIVKDLNQTETQQVIISKSVSEPQIYLAFYTQLDPIEYQAASKDWKLVNGWVDQQDTYSLGRFTFKSIDTIADFKNKNNVIVGKPSDFSPEISPLTVVNYPNLKPAYYIVSTK